MRLVAKDGPCGTVLQDLHQAGSAKVVFPRTQGRCLQAVTVNTAGGLTGGDRFEMSFEAARNTHLSVTTQAAERAYAAQGPDAGRLDVRLKVGAGARLDWLPQETILFENSDFSRHMRIDLAADASLLFVEPLVFGRAAMGETLNDIAFCDRVDIARCGVPVFADAVSLRADVARQMQGMVAGGAGAICSLVYVAPDAVAHLSTLRDLLPETAGASVIGDELLHVRMLAQDSFTLRQTLVPVLNHLTQNTLPKVWMI